MWLIHIFQTARTLQDKVCTQINLHTTQTYIPTTHSSHNIFK